MLVNVTWVHCSQVPTRGCDTHAYDSLGSATTGSHSQPTYPFPAVTVTTRCRDWDMVTYIWYTLCVVNATDRDEHTWKYPSFTMTFLLLFLLTCQDRTIFRWKNSILIAVSSVHLVHCFMDKNKLNCETVELINCVLLLDTCFMWIPQWVSYHLWYQRTPHTSHPDEQAPEHPEKKSREYS